MSESKRMRAAERAGLAVATVAAAVSIYVLTGNARLAIGLALLSLVIVWLLLALEKLAASVLGLLLKPLLLPLQLLLRLLGQRPRR